MPKKGNIPWNKGMKGHQVAWNKGVELSMEHKEKLRDAKLKNPVRYWLGKKRPGLDLSKRELPKGDAHWNWRGGINPINDTIRKSAEYKAWRSKVFKRDGYMCVIGGEPHGSNLNADHIKPFAFYPELRFNIDNGRTLCEDCHKKTDTYGRRSFKYNTSNSFNRWMLVAKSEQS